MDRGVESNVPFMEGYYFYDSRRAVSATELQALYRFTHWGKSRSLAQIDAMLEGTSLCFSVRHEGHLVAFCRMLTDFVFRGSLWDILVHPDHQGKGIGSYLIEYALNHPAVKNIPVIITFATELIPFMSKLGFEHQQGVMILQRVPIEYS